MSAIPSDGDQPAAVWVDDGDWIEADIPRRPWIAPGFLLRGAVTLLVGPPSAMKSSLALAWAAALALKAEFGRFKPVERATTIVYNVEDDQHEQRRRLSAVLRQFDAAPADIKGRVIRTGPNQIGTLVVPPDSDGNTYTPAFRALREGLEQTGASVLIVDPLAELHTAEENDNGAIRRVIAEFRRLAEETNIAVLVLHHTRKGAAASPGDPDIARGGSAVIGAVRVAFTLMPMTESDASDLGVSTDFQSRSSYIRLDNAKSNYAPLTDAEWFEKTGYELDNGEHVGAPIPWKPPTAKTATSTDLDTLAAAIERGTADGEPWSPRLSDDARSIRQLLENHGFVGRPAQKATIAALEANRGMTTADFRSKASRNRVKGCRIGDLPAADWIHATSTQIAA